MSDPFGENAFDRNGYGSRASDSGAFHSGAFDSGAFDRGAFDDEAFDDDFSPRLARPYAVTGGRTEAAVDLPVEALIETVAEAYFDAFQQSHVRIADLCHEPLSVAEIASALGIALGVARVLIGDLIVDGIVRKHQTLSPEGDRDQWRDLLERTLAGLRAL